MSLPRVLLLEDDASIRRFVSMALEELPIQLVECEAVAQAVAALREAPPVKLIITDLMLRNESGFDLLKTLDAEPSLIGDGLVAVFSAGLSSTTMKQLGGHRVWRVLSKPTTVAALEDCVREALAGPSDSADAAAAIRPPIGSDEAQAIDLHFGGEARLFHSYRQACLTQFAIDIAAADAAVGRRDAAELRRLGHSLKSVLRMLGQPELSARAKSLDEAAAGIDWASTQLAWQSLREGLQALVSRG